MREREEEIAGVSVLFSFTAGLQRPGKIKIDLPSRSVCFILIE